MCVAFVHVHIRQTVSYPPFFLRTKQLQLFWTRGLIHMGLFINSRQFCNLPNTLRKSFYFLDLRQVASRTGTVTSNKQLVNRSGLRETAVPQIRVLDTRESRMYVQFVLYSYFFFAKALPFMGSFGRGNRHEMNFPQRRLVKIQVSWYVTPCLKVNG